MVRQIQQSEFNETINRGITTIVKFEADWCGPCKAIKPAVESLSDEWSDKEVEFVSLDVDGAANIATLHSVFSVPTFIAFRNGQPVSEVRAQINEPNIRKTFEKHL